MRILSYAKFTTFPADNHLFGLGWFPRFRSRFDLSEIRSGTILTHNLRPYIEIMFWKREVCTCFGLSGLPNKPDNATSLAGHKMLKRQKPFLFYYWIFSKRYGRTRYHKTSLCPAHPVARQLHTCSSEVAANASIVST